jgi:hypothetical protein
MIHPVIDIRRDSPLFKKPRQVSSGDPGPCNRNFHKIFPDVSSMTVIATACTIDFPACCLINLLAFTPKSLQMEYKAWRKAGCIRGYLQPEIRPVDSSFLDHVQETVAFIHP